ncbi:11184_t:CDS:2, partial [Entrophospora sp. SA101]
MKFLNFKRTSSSFSSPSNKFKFAVSSSSNFKFSGMIYESENMLKVTDVVEFIGVFNHPRNIPEDNSLGVDVDDPTKLIRVPSIHAIFYRNLHPSGNPNLSSNIITHLTP